MGNQASAGFINSTAIGNGAATTRTNQVAVGTELNTYTLAGLTTDTSTAAQTGDIGLVTTDRDGNIAADFTLQTGQAANSTAIQNNQTAIATNEGRIASVSQSVSRNEAAFASASAAIALNSAAIDSNSARISDNIDSILDNRAGIAAALALDNAYVPVGQTFAVSGGVGYYDDEAAFAGSLAYRLNNTVQLSGAVTTGVDNGSTGARAGFQASW